METQMLTPTPGGDYPRTWNEFLDWFATEEACQAFLEKLRWPQGFVCPRCGNAGDVYRASRTRLMCRSCQYQGTVTSGTIFDKTRTPLRVWLAAAWYLTHQKQGVSALGLQRVLGLGSYQTAWTMLHRFRRAMVRPGRGKLKGLVALLHGAPVLGIPGNLDQYLNMHYLEKSGLGLALRGTQLAPAAVAAAASRLMGDNGYRSAAQAFAQRATLYECKDRLRSALQRLLPDL